SSLAAMGGERFVSLTTFRKSGVGVPTAVWIAPAGDGALVVTTPSGSGKVKRLRNNPSVEVRPCSRSGKVAQDAPVATGRAELVRDQARVEVANAALRRKYALEFRLVLGVEWVLKRGRPQRTILRITERATAGPQPGDE
ncbi:MAG: PPOX class F420-dependent oxidoreductase, partial [Ornithinimicrobium sp.]